MPDEYAHRQKQPHIIKATRTASGAFRRSCKRRAAHLPVARLAGTGVLGFALVERHLPAALPIPHKGGNEDADGKRENQT